VGKASSAKKVARAAKAGGRRKVRGQQGLVFPVSVALVLLLGVGLVIYSKQSQPAADASPPTLGQHWHASYGFFICDKFIDNLQNDPESVPNYPGIHSHQDGVIHIHPFTSQVAGRNSTLGKFFEWAGVKMTNDELVLPNDLGTYKNGDTCPGTNKKGTL